MKSEIDKFLKDNYPICLICNLPVNKFEASQDIFTDEIVFIAHCHGKTDNMRINSFDLIAISKNINKSYAFHKNTELLESK